MRTCLACVVILLTPARAIAAPAEEGSPWSVALTGGINAADGEPARPLGSVSIRRETDSLSLGLTAALADSAQRARIATTLPATTWQLTASAGHAFGALSLDGYAALGRRHFRPQRRGGASLSSDGTTLGTGATLTLDVPLGTSTLISPYTSFDYSRVDTGLIATIGGNSFIRKQRQDGVTGGLGLSLLRGLGNAQRHHVGITLTGLATSNDAASTASGGGAQTLRYLDGAGSSDRWIEGGASFSLAMSQRARAVFEIVRTVGLQSGDMTSVTMTLHHVL